MPRATSNQEFVDFGNGVITEVTPLNIPENLLLDCDNFILNRDKSAERRNGIDFESGAAFIALSHYTSSNRFSSHLWKRPNRQESLEFLVVQVGTRLYVFDNTKSTVSANLITTLDISTRTSGNFVIESDTGLGVLFMVTQDMDPFYLSYNGTAVTINNINVQIRDIFGVEDNLAVDTRLATLSNEHKYNLLNQGWRQGGIDALFAANNVYPSNADIQYLAKDSSENFDPSLLFKQFFGTTRAPRGFYVINAFERSNSRLTVSGIPALTDTEAGRFSTVAFHFGRAFYSGINSRLVGGGQSHSPDYTGYVFFSQTIRDFREVGKCYQEADPTSEHISDLIDTDGGTVLIQDSGKIHKLIAAGASLIVIAENGAWEIFGDEGGFRATSFQVSKISNFGSINSTSVINVEGNIFYWSSNGIYLLAVDQVTGRFQSQNITERTIQTRYNSIPSRGKAFAKGHFDPVSRKASWLYNDSVSYDGINDVDNYNRELIIDLINNGFYFNRIVSLPTNSPYITGYTSTPDFLNIDTEVTIVNNSGNDVINASSDTLIVNQEFPTSAQSITKYTIFVITDQLTIGSYRNESFRDWFTASGNVGVDAPAFMEVAWFKGGETQRYKGITYLTAHFKRTEENFIADSSGNVIFDKPSSCLVRGRWEFTTTNAATRWTQQFQAYRFRQNFIPSVGPFDYGYSVITTKSKLRGKGRSLSLRFDTEPDKDCHIYGYAFEVTGGTKV